MLARKAARSDLSGLWSSATALWRSYGEVAMPERDLLWVEGEAQVGSIRQFQEPTMDELRKACRRKAWVVFSYIAGVAAGKSFGGAFQ